MSYDSADRTPHDVRAGSYESGVSLAVRGRWRASLSALLLALGLGLPLAGLGALADGRPLEFTDLMRFRTIRAPVISEDGAWVAYGLWPDRGDGAAVVRSTTDGDEYVIERGSAPLISPDGRWVAAKIEPPLAEQEKKELEKEAGGKKSTNKRGGKKPAGGVGGESGADSADDELHPGLALVSTTDGSRVDYERVKNFTFSGDGRFLAVHHVKDEKGDDDASDAEEPPAIEPREPSAAGATSGTEQSAGGATSGTEQPAEETSSGIEPGEGSAAETSTGTEPGGPSAERAEAGPGPSGQAAEGASSGNEPPAEEEDRAETSDDDVGTTLALRDLSDGSEMEIAHVLDYAFSEEGEYLAYSVGVENGADNGLFVRALRDEGLPARTAHAVARGRYSALAWAHDIPRLAFVAAVLDDEGEPGDGSIWIWDREPREAVTRDGAPEGWFVPSVNELRFSKDGERLFLGLKPVDEKLDDDAKAPSDDGHEEDRAATAVAGTQAAAPAEGPAQATAATAPSSEATLASVPEGHSHAASVVAPGEPATGQEKPFDPYDVDALLERRGLDVWHWNDPRIVPNQKKRWESEKDRTYRAVYHLATDRLVPLADRTMRVVEAVDNPRATLGYADVPYLKRITWDGQYYDVYRVSLVDGSRQLVARAQRSVNGRPPASLSPAGRFVAYYESPHWYLFDGESGLAPAGRRGRPGRDGERPARTRRREARAAGGGEARNLTAALEVPFANEDHDYPDPAPGYGVAGWIEDDAAVLIYDKYDIWQFPTEPGSRPLNVTAGVGREQEYVFRAIDLDDERDFIEPGERLLLSAYHDREKHRGFYETRAGASGVESLVEEPKLYSFVARAKESDRLLFTRESYTEFPDLWVAGLDLRGRRRLSDANPQIDEFAWGSAELVEWTSDDGIPLQGVLIKPGGYEPGRRYPVLVYFYRLFSDRLHEFNEPVVNHRPSFPHYASHGYAVFLPDVRFEVGQPGFSATKSLVPGVKKLIEIGVADPDAIGLHGHSWSGYQTAFVITQTDLFAAAVAGAPVSNMTSAYSGIRLGTGLARQFQYEQSQSRLGKSLWDGRELYIENSPVFFADRIDTPLLIQFGDEDEAVPWQQGIELYLALRRLGKPAVFLQYRGEPHHLERYPNKLDYSIKMREFFDHYLKGAPAPGWMTEGIPYRGE